MNSRRKIMSFVFVIVTLTVDLFVVRLSDHTFNCDDMNTTTHDGETSVISVNSTSVNKTTVCCRRQSITEEQSYILSKVNTINWVRAVRLYVTIQARTYGDAHSLHHSNVGQPQPLVCATNCTVHSPGGSTLKRIKQNKDYDNNPVTVYCFVYQTITFTASISPLWECVNIEVFHNVTPNRTFHILVKLILGKSVEKCDNIPLLTNETSCTLFGHPANIYVNMLHEQSALSRNSCVHMIGAKTMSMRISFNSEEAHHSSRPRNHTKTRVAVSLPHSQRAFRESQRMNFSSDKMFSSTVTLTNYTAPAQLHREHISDFSRTLFINSNKDVLMQRLTFLWMFILFLKVSMKHTVTDILHSLMKMFFLNSDKMKHWVVSKHVDTDLCSSFRFHKKCVCADYDDNQIMLPPYARTKQTTDICLNVPAGGRWRSDTLCDKCRQLVVKYEERTSRVNDHVTGCMSRRAGQWEVDVRPVRRFLPDTTNSPDLDLAHVGYRLATLSALPPAVPVSRVKLADAGFYYRGQGDEVTCYACRGRHSGWTNDDKPWDVHRRISPNCPHVLGAPGGHGDSTATTGVSVPPFTAPHQDPKPAAPRGTVHGPEQATSQDVASQSSQLVTSQGSAGEAAPSQTSPRISEPNNNRHHAMNGHSEIHVEDGDVTNPTSLNTTTLTPAAARTEDRAGAQETMPPVYATSQAFTTSVQSVATNSPLSVLRSGLGRAEAANASSGTTRTDSSGDLNASGTGVGSRKVTATTSAKSANRSQVVPGDNTPRVGSGGSPSGRPSVAMVGTASAIPGGEANNTRGEEASARYMFPRAGLELGGAVYPMYQDMASRRRSFPRWDETHAPPLDQIILCGMFYAGYADCVRCFYCGVGLKHWEVTDDVWTEHVRWRPSCGYLKAVKGDDFIRRIQARLARETSGDDDNDDGPADCNNRPPGPPGPPIPQGTPGAAPQDSESRGESRSRAGSSALTRTSSSRQPNGNARSAPPSDTADPTRPWRPCGTLYRCDAGTGGAGLGGIEQAARL